MAYNEQFIVYDSFRDKAKSFAADYDNGLIKDSSIVFIEESGEERLITQDYPYFFVPSNGRYGDVLTFNGDLSYWASVALVIGNPEDILAYGVLWRNSVEDPHLTRIGNMSLHLSLPIQSLLKGCIAQNDKIMYWLDDENWYFRKDPILVYIPWDSITLNSDAVAADGYELTLDVSADIVAGLSNNATNVLYARTGKAIGRIEVMSTTSISVTFEAGTEILNAKANQLPLEIGARLDGYDGTVRVYCPSFYIKSEIDVPYKGYRRVWLSTVKIDDTWTYQPATLIDAYRSTVLNEVPLNMGYLSTLPVNSAISVVNNAAYCRGGNNNATLDNESSFKSHRGKPRTKLSRTLMRTYAKNAGSLMMDYNLYKNIFYWLYVVEYANFNCQEAYVANNIENYKTGGLGTGLTNVTNVSTYSNNYPITPCGYGNLMGNGTGIRQIFDPSLTPSNGVYMCRWRGFDNPFGDVCTNLDGIIIDNYVAQHPTNATYVYTCKDPNKYADNLNLDDYEKIAEGYVGSGYVKTFDLGNTAEIIPNSIGGNSTKYKCDYYETGATNATLRTYIVGGGQNVGSLAGIGYLSGINSVIYEGNNVGFRTVSVLS